MRGRRQARLTVVTALAVLALTAAACSNSSGSSGGGSTSSGNGGATDVGVTANSITVGSIATATGSLSQGFGEIVAGAKAYFHLINDQGGVYGRHLNLAYTADDQGNPTTDEVVARNLVEQNHVFAVIPVGTPFFSSAQYLTQTGTPTFGYVVSTAFAPGANLYGAYGSILDYTTGGTTSTFVAHQLQAKSVAVVAYGIAQSADACKADASKMRADGVNVSVEDLNFPIGGDPAPDVLQMQSKHVDMLLTCIQGSDNLAFARLMHQYGLSNAHAVWLNGYDRHVIAQNPTLLNGTIFLIQHVPFEAAVDYPGKYPAIDQYIATMKKYEPQWVYDDISFQGYVNAEQLVEGLRAIGPDVTQKKLVAAINQEKAFNANGLMSPVDWTTSHTIANPPFCSSFVEAQNGTTHIVFAQHGSQVLICFNKTDPNPLPLPPGVPG